MITLKNITKIYCSKTRIEEGVKDVSLSLSNAGFIWLKGKSGAGKSTLLNILSLQILPTSGDLYIEDRRVNSFTSKEILGYRREYFGIVTQGFDLLNAFSVRKNLLLSSSISGIVPSEEDLIKALEEVDLPPAYLDKRPFELSGGERQRVAITRALLRKPRVFVCDEPTGNLDEENALHIYDILKRISKDVLVIVVSHDEEVADYADRIILLSKKGVIDEGDTTFGEYKARPFAFKKSKKELLTYEPLLGLNFLKRGIKRFIFTSLTLIFAFSLALVANSARSFDKDKAVESLFDEHSITSFTIRRGEQTYERGTVHTSLSHGFSKEDYPRAMKHFGKDKVVPILNAEPFNIVFRGKGVENSPHRVSMFSPILEDVPKNFGFDLYGRLPKENSTNEIVLSTFWCRYLDLCSTHMSEEKAKEVLQNNPIESLTLREYSFDRLPNGIHWEIKKEFPVKVVGIVDTKSMNRNIEPNRYVSKSDQFIYSTLYCSPLLFNELLPYVSYEKTDTNTSIKEMFHSFSLSIKDNAYSKKNTFVSTLGGEVYVESSLDSYLRDIDSFTERGPLPILIHYGSLVFLFLSALSLLSLLKSILNRSFNEVRILQLLGLSTSSFFRICAFTSLTITLFAFALSLIPYVFSLRWLNNTLVERTELKQLTYPFWNYQMFTFYLLPILVVSSLLALLVAFRQSKKNVKNAARYIE